MRRSDSQLLRRLVWRGRFAVLGVAVVVASLIAMALSGPLRTWRDLERCRRGYAAARTASESLLVDRRPVEDRPFKHPISMRLQHCRATRGGPELGPLVEPQPSGSAP